MPKNALLATGLEMLFGGLLLLMAATVTGEWGSLHLTAISSSSLWSLLWLIGPGAVLGFTAYTFSLQNLPTNIVTTYAYVNPVVAVILGAATGDQPLTPGLVIGGAAVILAVAVTLVKRLDRTQAEVVPDSSLAEIA